VQIAQQQLQQAAALQAQTHLRAAAVSLGQQQNPYLSGMWPYNTYSAGPSWAAAAYARCASPDRPSRHSFTFHASVNIDDKVLPNVLWLTHSRALYQCFCTALT
jgi:hypothetical protein